MANVKISQLPSATGTTSGDQFMILQNGSNKQISLQTLLANLNSPIVINSQLQSLDFVVNGANQTNLLYTSSATNSVGILTNNPTDAALHVLGDIRVGGPTTINRSITAVAVGIANSGGTGYTTITITVSTSIAGVFNSGDTIVIAGLNVAGLNGSWTISSGSNTQSFTFSVPNSLNTSSLNTSPIGATATKSTYKPGLFRTSSEVVTNSSLGGFVTILASTSITGLVINGASSFYLGSGYLGQDKYIYLKSQVNSTDKATVSSITNGLGFNQIQFQKPGDAVSLTWDGSNWICLGVYGALVTTV